jgi:hypothetical protein
MSNSFTNLIPSLYAGLDVVSREMVGFIPAVNKDGKGAERAALNQTIYFPIAPTLAAGTPSPAATGPNPADISMGSDSLTLDKFRSCTFYFNGEEGRAADTGPGISTYLRDLVAQSLRTLVAEIETDLAAKHKYASRAYKVASGHTFDASDGIGSIAQIRKELTANGAPLSDLHLVVDPIYAASLRTQGLLVKSNEAGSDEMLRQGKLGRVLGFDIHESTGITASGSTAAASYVVDTAGALKGAVSVPIKTGTDAISAGDIVLFQSDTGLYVVNTALTGAGNLLINKPGLLTATVSTKTLTFQGAYTPLSAFSRNALTLVTRAPALPKNGDAGEHTILQDPVSGLAFDVARYAQYRREAWEVSICWGTKCTKSEHYGLIMGT